MDNYICPMEDTCKQNFNRTNQQTACCVNGVHFLKMKKEYNLICPFFTEMKKIQFGDEIIDEEDEE